jgi:2-C-methyl-D-erythritol 2,4-cyclodiphosphate synthase
MMRVGTGFDVHELVEGRPLWLGCVHFEDSALGLDGHSDADVVAHAVVDALLGACALGDIGEHFPDSDPAYSGYPGWKFLEAVRDKVVEAGYSIGNVDCTVLSDVFRLGSRKREMAAAVAKHLGIDVTRVSIKATTMEGHGPIGRGEMVGCQAIAGVISKEGGA